MKRLLAAAFVLMGASALANAPPDTWESKYCTGCHAVDKKMVGPAMKDVAAKYKDRKDAVEYLVGKIRKGGTGVWGQVPMPANESITEAEAKTLAEWLMKAK
jgi:cytochrome c